MNFLNLPFRLTDLNTVTALDRLQPKIGMKQAVSLRDLQFIDPFGMMMLLSYIRYLSMVLDRVWVYLPRNEKVLQYLNRSGFLREIAPFASLIPNLPISYLERDEIWLIPVQVFREEDDVPALVQLFIQSIQKLMQSEQQPLTRDQRLFCTLLSELCQNIPQHSRDRGYIAVQSYRGQTSREIHIALADLGIGLRGSLSQNHPVQHWSEVEVLHFALQQGTSASNELGRGHGLANVVKSLQPFQGKFYLRSGSGLLSIRQGKETYQDTNFFPGVQVGLVLKMNESV